MKETDLIDRLGERDFKAFEELVRVHQSMVTNLCFNLTGSRQDAEDLAQEVFIKVWEKADKFRGDSSLQTWIYRIAINTGLNYTRKMKFQKFIQPIETLFNIGSGGDDAQQKMDDEEQQNHVQLAIQSLPENQRIALTLRTFRELSYDEISDIMDVSVSSVESLLFRAKKNLKKKLADYYLSGL